MERKALGKLAGRFTFKTWENGETMVPNMALSYLATENVAFTVVGPADDVIRASDPNPPR